jgi:hypothetical protein
VAPVGRKPRRAEDVYNLMAGSRRVLSRAVGVAPSMMAFNSRLLAGAILVDATPLARLKSGADSILEVAASSARRDFRLTERAGKSRKVSFTKRATGAGL